MLHLEYPKQPKIQRMVYATNKNIRPRPLLRFYLPYFIYGLCLQPRINLFLSPITTPNMPTPCSWFAYVHWLHASPKDRSEKKGCTLLQSSEFLCSQHIPGAPRKTCSHGKPAQAIHTLCSWLSCPSSCTSPSVPSTFPQQCECTCACHVIMMPNTGTDTSVEERAVKHLEKMAARTKCQ